MKTMTTTETRILPISLAFHASDLDSPLPSEADTQMLDSVTPGPDSDCWESITKEGAFCGTPFYAAPEQYHKAFGKLRNSIIGDPNSTSWKAQAKAWQSLCYAQCFVFLLFSLLIAYLVLS